MWQPWRLTGGAAEIYMPVVALLSRPFPFTDGSPYHTHQTGVITHIRLVLSAGAYHNYKHALTYHSDITKKNTHLPYGVSAKAAHNLTGKNYYLKVSKRDAGL